MWPAYRRFELWWVWRRYFGCRLVGACCYTLQACHGRLLLCVNGPTKSIAVKCCTQQVTPPKPFLDDKKHYVFGEFPHAVRLFGTHPLSAGTRKMRLIP